VVSEIALSLILLAGAGLMIKSFRYLIAGDLGFRPDRVLSLRILLPDYKYKNDSQRRAFGNEEVLRVLLEQRKGRHALAGRRIVELGCGAGRNTAHLAAAGAIVTGVDHSPGQIHRARAHYAHTGATFVRAGATVHLTQTTKRLDVIVSVFGAIGTTEPSPILAHCSRRLTRCGVLAFAVPHPQRTGSLPTGPRTRVQVTLPNGTSGVLQHWDIDTSVWTRASNQAGLRVTSVQDLFAPADARWPTTLLITARKP